MSVAAGGFVDRSIWVGSDTHTAIGSVLEGPRGPIQQGINRPNRSRKERRKIERSNRVKSNHLVQAQPRRAKVERLLSALFLISTTAKKFQQVDARGSTVNNVGGDQINIVVNNPTSAHIEEMDEDITTLPVIFSLCFFFVANCSPLFTCSRKIPMLIPSSINIRH